MELVLKFNVERAEVSAMVSNLNKAGHGHLDQWLKVVTQPRPALLIIDLQNDFISGSLKVPEAQQITGPISSLASNPLWHKVILSQDWHPSKHISFFSNLHLNPLDPTWRSQHPGNISLFDKVTFAGSPPQEQVLWPDHCVQNGLGAEIHNDLVRPAGTKIIYKGTNPDVDSYSAFYDNTGRGTGSTGLDILLEDVTEVVVVGLATDYCVGSTTLDALCLGLPTTLLQDVSRPITAQGEEDMFGRVREAGGQVMTVDEWTNHQDTWDKAKLMAEFQIKKKEERRGSM